MDYNKSIVILVENVIQPASDHETRFVALPGTIVSSVSSLFSSAFVFQAQLIQLFRETRMAFSAEGKVC